MAKKNREKDQWESDERLIMGGPHLGVLYRLPPEDPEAGIVPVQEEDFNRPGPSNLGSEVYR